MANDIVESLESWAISHEGEERWITAKVIREAAAEIVRLRGEVCSCPSGDGSLRWPCKAHPPGAIAPAEAKGDECPNCVSPWKCNGPHVGEAPDHGYDTPQPADGGAVAWLPSAHEWLSENQGAASQDWMDGWNACRSRWQSITTQAPAVPTGAVWIMPVATDPPQNRSLMRMAWGASALSTGELANAYDSIVSAAQRCGQVITHPPAAQVQGKDRG